MAQQEKILNDLEVQGQLAIDTDFYLGLALSAASTKHIIAQGTQVNIGIDIDTKGTGLVRVPTNYEIAVAAAGDGRALINKAYHDAFITTQSVDANVTAPGSGEDKYAIIWDNASTTYKLGAVAVALSFSQGLTLIGSAVTLGGNVTQVSTDIALQNAGDIYLRSVWGTNPAGFNAKGNLLNDNRSIMYAGGVSIEAHNDSLTVTANVNDAMKYAANYNGVFTTRSIPDIGWTSSHLGTKSLSAIAQTPTGTQDGWFMYWNNTSGKYDIRAITTSGGSSTFIGLTDVPASYSGQTLKAVRVNAGETGLEFYTPSGGGSSSFITLTDAPSSYTGESLKLVRVNAGETGVEFFTASYESSITSGTTSQYWRGDKTFQTLDTSVVTENTNLYYTNARVILAPITGVSITGGSITGTDTVLQAFGKLQNQINGVLGGAIYQGVWNATSNSPTLTSSTGTKGYYYVVSVAGSTNLDGTTDWKVGDWAIFNGATWDKVDNTDAVSSVNGNIGAVALTGTLNRITVSGANVFDISASYVGQSSITTLGTVTTGTLSTGAIIAGVTMTLGSDASYDTYYRNSSGVLTRLANGTTGQVYVATTSNAPSWSTLSGIAVTSIAGTANQITASASTGAVTLSLPSAVAFPGTWTIGTLGYSDTGILWSAQSSTNGYNQVIIQNSSNGASASTNYLVSNDQGTASTKYGELGMNSSGFNGSGAWNIANGVYLDAISDDLAIGTLANKTLHFFTNSATTDNLSITGAGVFTFTVPVNGSVYTSIWTATSNTQNAFEFAGNITSRNTSSDVLNYLVIDPTLTRNAGNPATQVASAVVISPTFANTFTTQYIARFQNAASDRLTIGFDGATTITSGNSSTNTTLKVIGISNSTNKVFQLLQGDGATNIVNVTDNGSSTWNATWSASANSQYGTQLNHIATSRNTASDAIYSVGIIGSITAASTGIVPSALYINTPFKTSSGITIGTGGLQSGSSVAVSKSTTGMTIGTYTNVSPASSTTGSGALFTVIVATATTFTSFNCTTTGSGYNIGETVTFNGSQFGGSGSIVLAIISTANSLGANASPITVVAALPEYTGITAPIFNALSPIDGSSIFSITSTSFGNIAGTNQRALVFSDFNGTMFSTGSIGSTAISFGTRGITSTGAATLNGGLTALTFTNLNVSTFSGANYAWFGGAGNGYANFTGSTLAVSSSGAVRSYINATGGVLTGLPITYTVSAAGSGYTAGAKATTGGTGTGAIVVITVSGGAIATAVPIYTTSAGINYTVGDVLTVVGGTGGTVTVATVDQFGGVIAVIQDARALTDAKSNTSYTSLHSAPTYTLASSSASTWFAYYNPTYTSYGTGIKGGIAIVPSAALNGFGTGSPAANVHILQGIFTSSWVPGFRVDAGAHTGLTTATEFTANDFRGATQTWVDGTVTTQRFNRFRAFTANKTTTSATFTDIYNSFFEVSIAGSGVTFTRNWGFGTNGNLQVQGSAYIGGSGVAPTAYAHFAAGTTSIAPNRFTSGTLTTAGNILAGNMEFLTDDYYLTITTGTARKNITLWDTLGTSGRMPYSTTNGRLIDDASLVYDTTNGIQTTKHLKLTAAGGAIYIKQGSNATCGRATLVGGTVVVSTTAIAIADEIFLTDRGGTITNLGTVYISAVSAGTSFTITSTNILDASDVSWLIVKAA